MKYGVAAILVLAVAALLLATGEACEGVRAMSIPDACNAAASTDSGLRRICLGTLHSSPSSKLSSYAVVATDAAAQLCDAIANTIRGMLHGGALTNLEKTVFSGCYGDLHRARQAMAAAEDQLRRCVFTHLGQQYTEAMAAMDQCAAKLVSFGKTPLRPMLAGDREKAVLAYRLAAMAADHA